MMLPEVWNFRREAAVTMAGRRFSSNGDKRGPEGDRHYPRARIVTRQPDDATLSSSGAIERSRSRPRVIDANDPDSVLQDAERDMDVLSNDGSRVGIVDEIRVDEQGRRTSIVVRSGRLARRRMLVDGTLVDLVDDERVMLSIDPRAFKLLPVA